MKIVHISHLYHPSQGGVQTFFKNISERLVKDYGDDVTLVTTNSYYGPERKIFKKISTAEEVINGVKVIRFGYRRWHIKVYMLFFKILGKLSIMPPEWMIHQANGPYSPAMKNYLTKVKANAICASSSNYYYMQLPLWKKCNFFYYGSIHLNQDESKRVLYPLQVKSINASALYLANTNYEKQRIEQSGIKSDKVFVLGTGVNMDDFIVDADDVLAFKNKIEIPEDAITVGYIGRIEKTKNVFVVIKSFEKLATQTPNLYLLLAGSGGEYVDVLKGYCDGLPSSVKDRIRWQLNFTAEEKPLLFKVIDILVLPSHNESFGLVFLEAWSCKKPVIGTSIGAVKDVINVNEDGLLMAPDNVESLSDQLVKLIDNKDLREKMGAYGYEKVRTNYTWDIITARLRTCYVNGFAHNSEKSKQHV